MKRQQLLILVLVLLLPSAIAFNCNSLSGGDQNTCKEIQNSELAQTEKDILITTIINKYKTTPNYEFLRSWNNNLEITEPSNGRTYNEGIIKNAWTEIVSISPTIKENNILYSTNYGTIRTEYNYKYQLPKTKEKDDCQTDYYLTGKNEELNIYLNEKNIGKKKLLSFNISKETESLEIKSELKITLTYKIEHYQMEWVGDFMECRYKGEEYKTNTITLTDNIKTEVYKKNQLTSNIRVTSLYNNITRGTLEAENYTKIALTFNNSLYEKSLHTYTLNYSLPSYILTINANKNEVEKSNNININNYADTHNFAVKDSSKCKITLSDHFNTITNTCNLSYNKTELTITTDKTNYYENDTIKVFITPTNTKINITYGKQSRIISNYTEFSAELYSNKITAKINDVEVNRLINVNKKENIALLYNLGTLSFLGYLFYKTAKAYYYNKLLP